MQQQLEARIERLVCTIRTLRTAIEFREYWKETMPERLIQIANEVLRDELIFQCDVQMSQSESEVVMAERYKVERIEFVVGDGYRYRIQETDEGMCQIQYQELLTDGKYADEGQAFNVPFDVVPLLFKAAKSVYGATNE